MKAIVAAAKLKEKASSNAERAVELTGHGVQAGSSSQQQRGGKDEPADPNTLLAKDMAKEVLQGWQDVVARVGQTPPPGPRVGASLSCLKVVLQSHDLSREEAEAAEALVSEQQYGLFLFGGDDEKGDQTETLYIFYLQHHRWDRPPVHGKQPSKRSRHTATVVDNLAEQKQWLLLFGGVGASNAVRAQPRGGRGARHTLRRSGPAIK